jgi:hypothetical protein
MTPEQKVGYAGDGYRLAITNVANLADDASDDLVESAFLLRRRAREFLDDTCAETGLRPLPPFDNPVAGVLGTPR